MEAWIPLLQSLIWLAFIGILVLAFRGWFQELLEVIKKRVDKLVYHLHPSFPDPERETTERANSFEMTTYGWGQFNLSADVHFTDGSEPLKLFRYINF